MDKIKELRFGSIELEPRSQEEIDSRVICGYAAKFDKWSDPIYDYFIEKIERGAFDGCDFGDCIATFNHSSSSIMARTSSGTLELKVDDVGLWFRFTAPNTTAGNDMLELIKRGDISQCSFIFVVEKEEWNHPADGEYEQRTLLKIKAVYDVSLVTYPAYPDTDASIERSKYEQRCQAANSPSEEQKEELAASVDNLDVEIETRRRKIY